MHHDDRRSPEWEVPDQPTELELQLQEYDWSLQGAEEISAQDIKQALAALAVLGMEDDEDYEEFGSLWVH